MRMLKLLLCGLLLAMPVFANETEDRQTATSLKYVAHELDTRQDKLSAGANKAIEYTDSAGDITQRTVEANLNGADDSLPTVSAVTDGLSHKQDSIAPIDDHTAVTYTGTSGSISTKGIYQTTGTYIEQSDNLIDAKTFNAALKTGLDNEFVCDEDNQSPDGYCWLWKIHTTSTNSTLPAGYTQLEYISFDGTSGTGSYIDTGLVYYTDIRNTHIKFEADAKVYQGSGWQVIVGSIGSKSAYIGTNSANLFYYGAGFSDTSTGVPNPYTRCVHNFDVPTGKYTVYNTATTAQIVNITGIQAVAQTDNLKVLIGGFENSPGSMRPERTKMDLYSIKIYDNQTLKFNGIPAKHGNSVGLYDTVSNTFKPSANSSALIAGPVVNNNVYIPQNQ